MAYVPCLMYWAISVTAGMQSLYMPNDGGGVKINQQHTRAKVLLSSQTHNNLKAIL